MYDTESYIVKYYLVIKKKGRKSCQLQQHGWALKALHYGKFQTGKDIYCMISLMCRILKKQ